MSDANNAGDDVTTETNADGTPKTQERNWRQLEESRDAERTDKEKYRQTALKVAAEAAGYDVTKGVTQALINQFNGEDISVASFKQYATEQGLVPHSVIKQDENQQQIVTDLDKLQDKAEEVKQDLVTQQPTPKTVKEQIAEAQKNGDLGGALTAALGQDVVSHFDMPKEMRTTQQATQT